MSTVTDARVLNFRWGLSGEPQQMRIVGGRVVERASEVGGSEPVLDLEGRFLLPAFVDAHCHILPTGLNLLKLHLGTCDSHEAVLDALRDRLRETPPGKWLHAVHYDQNRYGEQGHITREQLDQISGSVPILLRHVNGHAGVANSATLRAAGIADDEVDPEGGSFGRDASGRLNGVLFETAHLRVDRAAPVASLEEMVDAILRAGEAMAALGIGTASDMMTGFFDLERELEAYRIASERGCKIRTRLYLQWSEVFGPRAVSSEAIQAQMAAMDPARCRVADVKIFADGAIGSATAAIYGTYTGERPDGAILSRHTKPATRGAPEGAEVSGQIIYTPERLKKMVQTAHEAGHGVAIHAIGDYAVDLVMDAFESTDEPSRHRLEHAMLLSDAQIERIAKSGVPVTFQPEFLMRFGHAYLRQLGPERTSRLKRARSVIDAGIPLSFNSDRPIVAGDPWDGILTASNRPDGFDPAENVTREEAILAYTVEGGRVNDDLDIGHLEPGAWADFQTLDEDPRTRQSKPVERPTWRGNPR